MPDGPYVTMPLGVFNCASTKPSEKNEVEFPLVDSVFFPHICPLLLLYAQIPVKYPVNFNI